MWRSHLIGLKVTDLSNTVRITSFTHYRTVISPINTGGLCTPSTKTSRGSVLHTPETNYILKGRWHTKHRMTLSAKQSLCWVWEGCRSNLKRGGKKKREKRIHVNRNSTVWHVFFDTMFPWPFLSNTARTSWELPGQEAKQKWTYNDKGRPCWGPKPEHVTPPWRTCPTAAISQCTGDIISNKDNNKRWRMVTMYWLLF